MSLVYKCDRCGRVIETAFDGGGNGPFVWDGTMSKDQEHFDLCESCYNSLIHWLNKKMYKSTKNGECSNCKYAKFADHMWPCNNCTHNCVDHWTEGKNPDKEANYE